VLAIVALYALRHRREPAARFLLLALALAAAAALGTSLHVGGHRLVPLPWALLAHLPGLSNVLPVRLALFATLAAAVIVALWLRSARGPLAVALPLLAVLALVPRVDLPVWSTTPQRLPFFVDGLYRDCLGPDENVIAVPYGGQGESMLWQAESGFAFRLAGGYIRPLPPPSFLRDPAVREITYEGDAPRAADLRRLVRDKHVTRIVVTAAAAPGWRGALRSFGPPTRTGGVLVYPACRADSSRSSSS
jgi:hypothetical protein